MINRLIDLDFNSYHENYDNLKENTILRVLNNIENDTHSSALQDQASELNTQLTDQHAMLTDRNQT